MPDDTATTIVVPCYNEEHRLDLTAFLELTERDDTSVVFVDDGSSDGTRGMLESFAEDHDHVGVLALDRNQGKGAAVREGFVHAIADGAETVAFLDADLATSPSEMLRIIDTLDDSGGWDVALGSRVALLGRAIDRSPTRHYLGRLFASLASIALRLPVYDTQCGAKAFRVTPSLEGALATEFSSAWAFDVELLARLRYDEPRSDPNRFVEVPLRAWTDVDGSKLSLRARFTALMDVLRVWRTYRTRR